MTLSDLITRSITEPRSVAQYLLGLNLPVALHWQAFVLCAVLSTLLTSVTLAIGGAPEMIGDQALASPVATVLLEVVINLVAVVLVTGAGQMAGGQGRFAEALLLVTWVQFLLLLWQVPQCAALILAPPLFLPLVAAGIVLLFWLLTGFTMALHGFTSPLRVFGAILAVFFLIRAAAAPFMAPVI